MSPQSQSEQETHLNMAADDRSIWEVFSDDPVMQGRLEKIDATLVRTTSNGNGKFYTIPAKQISFRMPAKPISEEKRLQLANQMRENRKRKV